MRRYFAANLLCLAASSALLYAQPGVAVTLGVGVMIGAWCRTAWQDGRSISRLNRRRLP
jgi:hypothetical protein